MRLPLSPELDSRNGTSNKDSRMTNALSEDVDGQKMGVVRPGLDPVVTASGAGRGMYSFNDTLISVFGTTLGYGTGPTTIGTVSGAFFDFAQAPL